MSPPDGTQCKVNDILYLYDRLFTISDFQSILVTLFVCDRFSVILSPQLTCIFADLRLHGLRDDQCFAHYSNVRSHCLRLSAYSPPYLHAYQCCAMGEAPNHRDPIMPSVAGHICRGHVQYVRQFWNKPWLTYSEWQALLGCAASPNIMLPNSHADLWTS
jgi:hypothetical protein